jgi:chemotaxis protein methyltransferase CheR
MNAVAQSAAGGTPPDIDAASFERLARIVHGETGIVLTENKKSLLVSRLARRVKELGLVCFGDYCTAVQNDADELRRLTSLLTTNVTSFFREPHHFEALAQGILPTLAENARRGQRVRIWSAGCSSGQEPYSIAISLLEILPEAATLDVRVLATDIDPAIIAAAERGIYPADGANLPPAVRSKYFETSTNGVGMLRVADNVRRMIKFAELNLLQPWPFRGPFDVIFCRNVVIYFDAETKAKLWARFAEVLTPGGYLFTGHSERVAEPERIGLLSCGVTQYRRN